METKNLTISLPKRVWEILEIDFAGLGDTEAERIQHIVMFLLSNKDYFHNSNKLHDYTDIYDNMDILEYMILSTVELLEEKNIITYMEWKERMGMKVKSWYNNKLLVIYIIYIDISCKHSKSVNSKPKSPCNFLILLAYFILLPNCHLLIAIQ